jgi:hypothetical protein
MKMSADFESHFISVTNLRFVCLLPIVCYVLSFLTHVLGDMKILKCFLFLFINIIYGLFNTTEIHNRLFKTLFYPENI